MTPADVADRLREAMETLALVRLNTRQHSGYRSAWPEYLRTAQDVRIVALSRGGRYEDMTVRPAIPDGRRIDQMDEAMGWLSWLRPRAARLVMARATPRASGRVPSWRWLARKLGEDRRGIKTDWMAAMVVIARKLNHGP